MRWFWPLLLAAGTLEAQSWGTLAGRVKLAGEAMPLEHAAVLVVGLGRSAETDPDGMYEISRIPIGSYDVLAHLDPLSDQRRRVEIRAGETTVQDFELRLAPVHEHLTVTASGRQESTLDSIQTVTSLDQLELAARNAASLGEVLENETGIAKRSSGPGSSRPVVRGFDGDRVLILQDGISTGTLSYQSADHGEPMDVTSLERLEVVRGPATLLYGSSAIGGVVNAVSSHHQIHQVPHAGLRGRMNAQLGSNNGLANGGSSFEYGHKKWLLFGSGGAQSTGDYRTPLGEIGNSHTSSRHTSGGLGRYGERYFASASYALSDGRYGIPVVSGEEPVDIRFRRHNARLNAGVRNADSAVERFTAALNYSDWSHRELENASVHNRFFNKQFSYRGVFDQRRQGRLTGSFGFMGHRRDYQAAGDEVFTPAVTGDSFAVFGLEEVNFERAHLQFGGRIERTGYSPEAGRARSFTGFSGSAGAQIPLWRGGSAVASYTHSFRAPALEELYAQGPHAGNLTFEIGDAGLGGERAEGLELSLRHHGARVRGDLSVFRYWMRDYIFLAPTGALVDSLVEAEYRQGDAVYRGAEARLDVAVHPSVWLNFGLDAVRAGLRPSSQPLPRIPPLRGRLGFDLRYRGFSLRPWLHLGNEQNRVFPTETRTAGYGVMNLTASYVVTRRHTMHIVGLQAHNLADNLYRNHLSLIKERAPEIGRGFRFFYTLQTF